MISVFGLGRVGLVTAVCLANKGYQVIGIDRDRHRLEKIRNSDPLFFEPKVLEYNKSVIASGKLSVTEDASMSARSDLVYITVGTPSKKDGGINLGFVKNAAIAIGQSLRNSDQYQMVIVKSTVIPGTARNLVKPIIEKESGKKSGKGFGLSTNPEFLREGKAIHDTEYPDRIVIGSEDSEAIKNLESFYRELYAERIPPILRTTHENAELIKYANNAFLAMKVSFINTIANIAESMPGADVKTIAAGLGLDDRVGPKFLNAGFGWGGSCFPKDLSALITFCKSLNYSPRLIEAVVEQNRIQSRRAIHLAKRALRSLKGKRIAVLGLAFKPKTDDMREAVSIPIIKGLLAQGAKVVAYDPAAMKNARGMFQDAIQYATNPRECMDSSDCCIIVTEWEEFKTLSPSDFVERMRKPVLIDGRRIYDAVDFTAAGVRFFAVGLGPLE